jgi:hypothetical protein
MELLTAVFTAIVHLIAVVLSVIGVAIVGLFGHVVAHDFCELAPTLARWLISFATKRLPPTRRAHYMEEWTADLDEREGVLAKLWHAIGCVWCAPSIRRQLYKDVRLRMSFNLPGIGQASLRTNLFEVRVVMRFWFVLMCFFMLMRLSKAIAYPIAYFGALVAWFFLNRAFVDVHERSGVTREQFTNAITKTKRDDWMPTAINLTMQGESFDLLGGMRTSFTPPVKMEAYFIGTLMAVLSIQSRLDGVTFWAGAGHDMSVTGES